MADGWDPAAASLEKARKKRIWDALGGPWDLPGGRTWDPTGTGHVRSPRDIRRQSKRVLEGK